MKQSYETSFGPLVVATAFLLAGCNGQNSDAKSPKDIDLGDQCTQALDNPRADSAKLGAICDKQRDEISATGTINFISKRISEKADQKGESSCADLSTLENTCAITKLPNTAWRNCEDGQVTIKQMIADTKACNDELIPYVNRCSKAIPTLSTGDQATIQSYGNFQGQRLRFTGRAIRVYQGNSACDQSKVNLQEALTESTRLDAVDHVIKP